MHPLVLGACKSCSGTPRVPAAPHADHRHRPGRAGPDRAPRPVGVRLLPVPQGYEVQCNTIWALTTSPRRTARPASSRAATSTTTSCGSRTRTRCRRRWRVARCSSTRAPCTTAAAPTGRARSARHQHHLRPLVAAAGGEPVPLVPDRGRPRARRGPAAAHGLLQGRVRARLHRRRSGPDRGGPPRRRQAWLQHWLTIGRCTTPRTPTSAPTSTR